MESDADRLGSIRALGGQPVVHPAGTFIAIFDNGFSESLGMEERSPQLMCRSVDIAGLKIVKGVTVTVAGVGYRVRRIEPDGTGMSSIQLEK